MDPLPDYSLFLVRILEELDTKRNTMSYQDLCKSLCARFDLVHLAKLRSLLFYTACLDPAFPATLFKDKMRSSMEDPQSKKLMVAADIVTMFNLIQMNGGIAKDKLPIVHRAKLHKNQSVELCRSENDAYKYQDCDRGIGYEHMDHPRDGHHHHHHHHHHHSQQQQSVPPKSSECNNCQRFIPASDPNFLLGVSKDLKCRAASLDKLHHLPQYSSGSPPSPPCEMQSTYFPMDIDSESNTDHESLQHIGHQEPFSVHSCIQKRNIFKEDFHNFVAFSPQVITGESKQGAKAADGYHRREMHKPATFFNHSFELPYSNPYFEPPLNSPLQDRRRVKHESLDDLQASTYFGPTTVSECVSSRKHSSKAGKQPSWPVKSLSLNTEEGPPDFERPFLNSKPLKENHHCNISIISTSVDNEQHFHSPKEKVAASPGFVKKTNGLNSKDASLMASGPSGLDKREIAKRFRDKNIHSASFQGVDSSSSVGTQTELAEQKKLKEFQSKYGDRERHAFKHSDEDSEIISDDISDIFRFLDDMSVCDSLGIVQSSCYNSNGSLSQVTLKSGDSSPERNTVKLAKSKLDRLFHSLENTDDELKSSVCKLVMRIGEIEKKLESLSGVRSEISQVLSKLNKLDEKIQEPEANGRQGETNSASGSNATPDKVRPHPHPHSENTLSPHVFQCHTTGHNVKADNGHTGEWCCSDGSNTDSLRMKALKKSMFTRRSSRSLNEENSATESKVASITNSPRDWRTVSYSCHPGDESKDKDRDRDSKDRHRKAKERERQYELPQAQRPPKPPKETYLVEQVFSPHPFTPTVKAHVKGSPLYTDLRLTSLSDGKRGQPTWTIEEYKRSSGEKGKQLTALDLQTQESLNPNNLEYWMEDIYTPGYDSLLKRKEAEFRRAKACKIGALIAAATCTVILVIVVPICTMKS
ncbi:major intrinsically disordered Notch2-binding receptor 1 isoform X2 [Parambassis ranga]|uniref:Major intrinsically disordered Notch2-binding receptor 1 isoform X2 n=1 Tax=Parambassis ranga TaxID=210632 RepID=A0A6P7I5U6_9TELE|nr:major intrinsically disordered Notch2-binding receptor 1 isoform X2 [Parambassis ranga]